MVDNYFGRPSSKRAIKNHKINVFMSIAPCPKGRFLRFVKYKNSAQCPVLWYCVLFMVEYVVVVLYYDMIHNILQKELVYDTQ